MVSKVMRVDPIVVQHEILRLLAFYPDLVDDEVLRADMIEGETEAHDFLSRVVRLIGEDKSRGEGITIYIKELAVRQERMSRRVEALRELAFKVMATADLKQVELPEATLSIRGGSERVVISDEAAVPDALCEIKRTPNKTRIKELIKSGEPINWASLVTGEPTLSVRTK